MTAPLTPNVETDRIQLNCGRTANATSQLSFPAKRPPLSGQSSARIFRPGHSVMTSARSGAQPWRLVFERRTPPFIDALMGYTGGDDTLTQVTLDFPTLEAAIAFAERQNLAYAVVNSPPERPRPNVRSLLREPRKCSSRHLT
ncbi:NADH dehydrogenase ubiquinone Fe-S protein 4 [Aminobacter sp. MDW-2]|uniref:NADH dehydrogenase ubiquinone Fe-S protein 4 n=2 Tax=Aminobacter sp. MDW-2 TaxID=2666139 RepID=UPI0012B06914|nr:NADH dehydrogenase ubiquinone Fe-S protein 4 [Aminobacter sp. MDW-2]MRX37407.1 proton-conducting membrane transporter [Aminobacter sp. MDW-2]QNH35613.1 ETC complex I subunit [Aminobacter sp. MDW-2]